MRTKKIDDDLAAQLAQGPLEQQRAANAKRHASAWLDGPSPDFIFPSADFAAALRYRLALHENWGSRTARLCVCGFQCNTSAEYSHHVLGCTKRKGANVSTRHTALKNEFAKACRENLLTTRVEPKIADGDYADLLCFFPPNDLDAAAEVIADFTVTSTLAKYGASEEEATKKKNARYDNKNLIVAQMDVTGGMSNAICGLIRHIANFSDDEFFVQSLRERAAKTVQQFNGQILRRASLKNHFGASLRKFVAAASAQATSEGSLH